MVNFYTLDFFLKSYYIEYQKLINDLQKLNLDKTLFNDNFTDQGVNPPSTNAYLLCHERHLPYLGPSPHHQLLM